MLNGVGAAIIIPNSSGRLTGTNELNLNSHGTNSLVSGWMAVIVTVYAS